MLEQARFELKRRCHQALANGFQIAHAKEHVNELSVLFGSISHEKPGSTEHLLALLDGIASGTVHKTVHVKAVEEHVKAVDELLGTVASMTSSSKKGKKDRD